MTDTHPFDRDRFDSAAQQRKADAIGYALYRAGLTSYPYATADIDRLLSALRARGYDVAKR